MTRLEELQKRCDGLQLEVLVLVKIWREHRGQPTERGVGDALSEKYAELERAERTLAEEQDAVLVRARAS